MRMRAIAILLTILSVPVQADELQFTFSGAGGTLVDGIMGPSQLFSGSFMLNTLSGPSSFTFGGPGGVVNLWSFSGADVTNLSVIIDGKTVVNSPSETAAGGGSPIGSVGLINSMSVGPLGWNEFDTDAPSTLNPQDPLADFFLTEVHAVQFANLGDFFGSFAVTVTDVSVPEPGMLALMSLGLTLVGLRRRRMLPLAMK